MKLTPQHQEHARAKLEKLWRCKACDFCGGSSLTIAADVVELRAFHGGALVDCGSVTPAVAALCATCGATKLFNAIVLGLIDPDTGKPRMNT
jgi:hypothetical protein